MMGDGEMTDRPVDGDSTNMVIAPSSPTNEYVDGSCTYHVVFVSTGQI